MAPHSEGLLTSSGPSLAPLAGPGGTKNQHTRKNTPVLTGGSGVQDHPPLIIALIAIEGS